jgi:putative glutamine amidotransferase
VLGICRGMQLLNVGRGGTLYQDVTADGLTQMPHRDLPQYELYTHEIVLEPGSRIAGWFPEQARARVNSIHHQSLKRLGEGLVVEARATDGVIEAVRLEGADFVYGVQWHPEFHPHGASELLSPTPLLEALVEAADRRRSIGAGVTA